MVVNVFLSSRVWAEPLNAFGVRHHVTALYDEVFRAHEVRIYPKRREGQLPTEGIRHLPMFLSGDVNVLTQGYPIISGALASLVRRNLSLIVHTWKVPGISDSRLSAQGYDVMLRRVIDRARAVVVANHNQRRQIEALGVDCPVIFAPVSVDGTFWHPEPDKMDVELAGFGLQRDNYVLTVGGSDRDELYGARLARTLGIPYVRATYLPAPTVQKIRTELVQNGLDQYSRLLEYPSDVELRALYAGARIVCLPTMTKTNPAGLSAMVEAMACGALVGIPEYLAEGYVTDRVNGLLLSERPEEFAERLLNYSGGVSFMRSTAREFADRALNVRLVAANLQTFLVQHLKIYHQTV